ncbi:hypothetical protein ACFC2F_23210 [Enterobacter sichuanensis]|uniref:tail fiber/spike domain-containing protein n=1 Tax=Enterobacter sichuanensis TaxID=2071710 RepID=UPI0036D3BFC9
MATQPTNLPVPSESPRDLKFNAGKIDEFVTSLVNTYADRFGNEHYTIEGLRWLAQQAISQYGWILIESFQDGADIALPNQALRDEETGEYYRWDGALPKHVDPGSTPASSGGVGVGAWIGIGDASLRSMLASKDGYSLIGELQSVADFFGMTGIAGKRVRLKSWYEGSNIGGGEFYYDTTVPKSNHDGGIYISPTVPYSNNLSEYVLASGEIDSEGVGCWVRNIDNFTHLTTDMFGMRTDGSAHADAFQKLSDACSKHSKHILVTDCKVNIEKSVNINNFLGSTTLPYLQGINVEKSVLALFPLGASNYSMIINATVTSEQGWVMSDIRVQEGGGLTKTAYGIYFNGLNRFKIERCRLTSMRQIAVFENCIYGDIVLSSIHGGYAGLSFFKGNGITNPNTIKLQSVSFTSMESEALRINNGTLFILDKCSIEGCGNDGETTFRGIRYLGGGSDGPVGLIVRNSYFESNTGYNIQIEHSVNRRVWHKIFNNTLNVTSATRYVTGHIVVLGGNYIYTGSNKMILECCGNWFWATDVYTGSASRPNVSITGYSLSGNNHCDFYDFNNQYIINEAPQTDSVVNWLPSSDFSFEGRVSSSGILSNSRNITGVTRSATGVYVINANHTITAHIVCCQLVTNPGSVVVTTESSGTSVTVRTYDSSGTAADRDFYVVGRKR